MTLVPLAAGDIARLEPLWLQLHAHHRAVAPELAPYVSDKQSWAARRAQYEAVMDTGGFGVMTTEAGQVAGYAIATTVPAPWPATFVTADRIGELMTLVVGAAARGKGLGGAMLDAIDSQMRSAGIADGLVGLLPGNLGAERLYARRGYRPAWLTLSRFRRPSGHPAARADVAIRDVLGQDVDALKPLWLALHHHHQSVAAHLGPFVGDEASWSILREFFLRTIDDGLLLRAERDGRPIGLACVRISDDTRLLSDTWATGPRVAEIKILVVAAQARGQGVGSALLAEIDRRLRDAGVEDQMIGAIVPNTGAIRLYERHGFRPMWLQMSRFAASA